MRQRGCIEESPQAGDDERVRAERVSRRWGGTVAVDELSFVAAAGEFLVVLGPSGCGKSTTLRLLAGLEPLSGGRVWIDGADVSERPPAERGIAMVFQSYALFPHLNVAENIVFGLRSRGAPRAERERRLRHAAEMVGLEALLQRRPAQLSGGQRQRVALARAVISEHPICLMDEPLSNLDARLRAEMRRELKALQRRLAMTVIYVTHDQVEAMSMGDRVLLLDAGRLVQAGTPEALYERPANRFAAGFIGSPPMNLVPMQAVDGGAALPGLHAHPLAPREAADCVLGLRPERLRIAGNDGEGLPAVVSGEEYLGADTLLTLQAGDASLLARLPGRRPLTVGEAVRVSWPDGAAHLFDGETGERRDDVPLARPCAGDQTVRSLRPPASSTAGDPQ